MKKYAKLVSPEDNIATCVADVKAGEEFFVKKENQELVFKANQDIAFGHKVAVKDIENGSSVFKYGVEIGFATEAIKVGDWVHTHNVKDNYEVK